MELAFYAMSSTRDSKKNRPIPVIRGVVGRNVEILRDRVYKEEPTVTGRNNKLAKAIGTKLAQIQRIIAGKIGTSIDTIEWLAEALGVRPQDLLTPYFANSKEAAPPSSVPTGAQDEAPLQRNKR